MKQNIKRKLVFLLSLTFILTSILGAVAFADYPSTVTTVAEGFVIYDASTGETILGKEATTRFFPASITKIMTGLLVCENIKDLNQEITFSQEAIAELTSDSSTLVPAAVVGEKMTIKDVLYGMFYISSNECAAQLGITVAGSREAFAQMMNDKAKEIGCTETHFVNAHGLHDQEHYSTPTDMAKIMAAALKNEAFFNMATGMNYVIPATNMYGEKRELTVSHQIVNGTYPYAEVFAGKTGRTPYALRTLVTAAQFGSHTVIIVIMKSSDAEFYNDTLKLLEYARGYCNGTYSSMEWNDKQEDVYVTGTNSLKVRDYPAQSGTTVVGNLNYGQKVKRTGTWGDWSQIEYMGKSFYAYSDYLTTKEPDSETMETITTTAREVESVDFSVVSTTTEAATTMPPETTTKAIDVSIATQATGADGEVIKTSADSENKGIISNMQEGPIKTIMIVCIVVMVVLAAAAVIFNLRMKNQRKKKRDIRRKHQGDEFWKQ